MVKSPRPNRATGDEWVIDRSMEQLICGSASFSGSNAIEELDAPLVRTVRKTVGPAERKPLTGKVVASSGPA